MLIFRSIGSAGGLIDCVRREGDPMWKAVTKFLVLALVLAAGVLWMSAYYNVYHARLMNGHRAELMLRAAAPSRIEIGKNIERLGAPSGSGKGVPVPPGEIDGVYEKVAWNVSEDGHILGKIPDRPHGEISVEWIPQVEGGTVVGWHCTFSFPPDRAPSSLPACPPSPVEKKQEPGSRMGQ